MPNIIVKVPEGLFSKARLAQGLTAAAKTVEQIGDDPRHLFSTWVLVEEFKAGDLFAAGQPVTELLLPVMVMFHHPEGVVDAAGRALAAKLFHDAVEAARLEIDPRPVHTSIIMSEVRDGTWGASGVLWRLPDLARAAGYKHLQHLVTPQTAAV